MEYSFNRSWKLDMFVDGNSNTNFWSAYNVYLCYKLKGAWVKRFKHF